MDERRGSDLSRREFLGAAGAALAPAMLGAHAAGEASPPSGWFDRPMRWAQLTLVEDDPAVTEKGAKYDPGFWIDYFRRVHADAACLSAGGVVAYYPTRIPLR